MATISAPRPARAPHRAGAYYDLGLSYLTGTSGKPIDCVEAHKWFNLAAACGSGKAAEARADLALDMSPQQIAAAQRAARGWLQG